ncbi:hypothetical protein FOQG_19141 [Fusarium oxysporum f. sp. raphani 54005]|uniref:Uncharacterized protein n=1 Tax=Fusarium oxysporum f. sp. raphani 54005 TaxID=1089458 RepID=X0B1V1_FUSOX|nr:hypothetical protein FOQG_19141 [Fusarium oxysporum f. sp. raphani 54005]
MSVLGNRTGVDPCFRLSRLKAKGRLKREPFSAAK